MNKEEEKIIHGLYYDREKVGAQMSYTSAEIYWLMDSKCYEGKKWRGNDGRLKHKSVSKKDYMEEFSSTNYAVDKPLSYLQESGYIKYEKQFDTYCIAVTAKGADIARELNTRMGRINIYYKRNKDGLLWFVATVAVSIITSIIVSIISSRIK